MLRHLLIGCILGCLLCAVGGTAFYFFAGYKYLTQSDRLVFPATEDPPHYGRASAGSPPPESPKIGAGEEVRAATAAVADMAEFCKRNRAACEVGGQAATVSGRRAQPGARKLYEIVRDKQPPEKAKAGQKPEADSNEAAKLAITDAHLATDCSKANRSAGIDSADCDTADLETLVEGLRQGEYVFNKPDRAYVGVPFRVVLVLKTLPDTQDARGEFKKTEGEIGSVKAGYGRFMEATLRGLDLAIDPEGAQRKTATSLNFVEWEWIVAPKAEGNKTITLDVNAIMYLKNTPFTFQLKTFHTDIDIRVTPFQRIKAVLAEAGGTVLGASTMFAALIALFSSLKPLRRWLLRFLRERRRKRRAGLEEKEA